MSINTEIASLERQCHDAKIAMDTAFEAYQRGSVYTTSVFDNTTGKEVTSEDTEANLFWRYRAAKGAYWKLCTALRRCKENRSTVLRDDVRQAFC